MNRYLIEGNWNLLKGKLRVFRSRLVGDHLGVITGMRMQSAGERQLAYGALRSNKLRGNLHTHSPVRGHSSRPAAIVNRSLQIAGLSKSTHESH